MNTLMVYNYVALHTINTACCDAFLSPHCLKISAIYATVTHLLAYTKQESLPSFFRINKYWLPNLLLAAGVFLPFKLLPIGNITGREQPPNLFQKYSGHNNLAFIEVIQIFLILDSTRFAILMKTIM